MRAKTVDMSRLAQCAFLISLAVIVLMVRPSPAHGYPQWQLSTGAVRCSQCHYAPAGGGLINSYGRDAIGEELSTFEGNGAFLHGAVRLPSWLAVGGDVRGALLARDVQDPGGVSAAAFPMQGDLYARFALPNGFSLYGGLGLRAAVRNPDLTVPGDSFQPVSTSRLISREHYATFQPVALGPYVRVGRFYAPYGLRLAEHVTYIRRDLGFNQLQESYNVSTGTLHDQWELHLTAFMHDFIRHIGSNERGLAAYYERRLFQDRVAVGAQSRVAGAPGVTRWATGGLAKVHVPLLRTLFLAEANLVEQFFDDRSAGTRSQMVGAAGFSVLPIRGLMATVLAERNQVDLAVSDAVWNAATAFVSWFPYAHVEVQVMGRLQFPGAGTTATTFLAQLHYFL